jgi:outer membrane cobalamin receptor
MRYFLLVYSLFISTALSAQVATFSGAVLDSVSNENIINAVIYINNKPVGLSDYNGKFTLPISNSSEQLLEISAVGYEKYAQKGKWSANSQLTIKLFKSNLLLNTVVVSASKFEKNWSEETVSMEVLKPTFIQNNNFTQMDDALNKVSGVDVVDGQANIRGGGGWSYGAGSRVLVLVDDMPMLTADAGDAKWDFLPIENCEQVEVIKGASSSLYGSSALNGVIHFRTAFAKNKPQTKITYYSGWGGAAADPAAQWWGEFPPICSGVNFFHSEKIKQLDWVIGGAGYTDFNRSYLQGDYTNRGRINMNLRYRVKQVEGLSLGCNVNMQKSVGSLFFYWKNDTSGVYQPYGGLDSATTTLSKTNTQRINIDPYITYVGSNGFRMSLRSRLFRTNNINNTKQGSKADLIYTEQQFQKQFSFNLNLTGGLVHTYSKVSSQLYNNHEGNNLAAYLQAEQKIKKLWISLGWRYEMYRIDNQTDNSKPVWRAGLNYQLGKATFLRSSWGMGYRFPSIGEKFVRTNVGAANVLPNPKLKAERGNSAEVGIKQGFRIGKWEGYADLSYFTSVYNNMTEFQFNEYYSKYDPIHPELTPPDSFLAYLGFAMVNITRAQINGVELTAAAKGKIGAVGIQLFAGYTFLAPKELSFDSSRRSTYSNDTFNFLKYRVRHTLKADVEANYKKWTIGTGVRYYSKMINIDKIFENNDVFAVNIGKFRKEHAEGNIIWDARLLYQINSAIRIGLNVKNILNQVYTDRPANPMPPRNYSLQLVFDL